MKQRIVSVLIFLLVSLVAVASGTAAEYVRGIVRDSLTLQGLPYASITVLPSGATAVADSRGLFELTLPKGSTGITARCQGYATLTVPVKHLSVKLYDIALAPEAQELKEVVVKKKKYSKRNNPAVDFARRLKSAGEETDPRRNDWYGYDRYERITIAVNDFDTAQTSRMMKSMPFLAEHVDTSEISGNPVLNISLKEKATTELWKRDGHVEKTIVRGTKSEGVDEFLDSDNVQVVLSDLLREIDLYQGDIHLLRNNFTGPLSGVAADFYRFYLVDSAATVAGSDKPHIVLAFYPRNKSSFGFTGHVYVSAADTSMMIRRVEMHAPKEINLNFIKDLTVVQNYDRAPDGSRLKTSDDLLMVLSVLPNMPELYVTRKTTYRNHSFAPPADADSIFGSLGRELAEAGASDRDSTFWQAEAVRPIAQSENRTHLLMERLRRKPLFYWGEKVLKILSNGYVGTGRDSRFDIGPVNTFASYNSLEGLRLKAGGMTTANLSRHWFGRGYLAHGFRDHRWKYGIDLEYSFNAKKYHPREFPVHSLRLTHRYDIDRLGSHYLYTSPDNFVLSLERIPDRRFTYLRETKLEYTLELANNFSVTAAVMQQRQNASPYVRFETASGIVLSHYDQVYGTVQLRYAPGEKFVQGKTRRMAINREAPVFTISHRFSPKGFCGSRFGVNRTEISVSKEFNLSFMGYLDVSVDAGHVWGEAPFTELLIPNANLSYTIQPRSFALMNPMEFINSSFVSWHASWQLRGAFFNLIPGVRRLGLREVFGFSGLWGRRSSRNNPTEANGLLLFPEGSDLTTMGRTPYMELSAGIDNICRLLRVDYVYRLSYRDVPYEIDRHGIRVALHFTF